MVPVPTVLPENHKWQQSKGDPLLYQRRGNGAEAIVGLEGPNSEGQYDLYYRVNMHLSQNSSSTKISLSSLKDSFKLALLDVRLQHPEIACTVAWDTAVGIEPIIQYKSPVNDTDAVEWAEERIQVLTTPQTALDLRTVLVKQRELTKPGPSAPVKVYILADVANQTIQLAPNSKVDILIHLNHLFWDGIGVRMFVGDLLKRIGKFLDNDNIASRKPQLWGQEKANLPQPILDIGKINPKSLGPDFEPWWNEYIENMFKSTDAHGFKFTTNPGTPRTIFHTFTVTESTAMVDKIKARLGPGFTMSHLGNAAILLALLKVRTLPADYPEDKPFIMTVPVNGRRWIRDDLVDDYYIMSQTGAVVKFDRVKSLTVDYNDRPKVVDALERACRDAKASYDYWLNNPYQGVLGVLKDNLTADYLHSNPVLYGAQAAPFYISDGVNDKWVPEVIKNPTTGEKVMVIDEVAFFLDQFLPYMAIRLDSFKGRSALSLCFNDGHYTHEEATNYLECISNYMLAFT